MMTSAMAWFVGNTQIIRFGTIQAQVGIGQELIYIVAAVIGGCLLTGGYGSAVGASLGALIFGMTAAGHRLRQLELRLVQAVRRRHVAAGRAGQPIRPALSPSRAGGS